MQEETNKKIDRGSTALTVNKIKCTIAMAESSQFSPLNTLSDQLGPNSWVSSVVIPAFIANIGKYFFLKYDRQSFKSI